MNIESEEEIRTFEEEMETTEDNVKKQGKKILKLAAIPNSAAFNFYHNFANLLVIGLGATPLMLSFITSITNLGQSILQGIWGRVSDIVGRRLILIGSFLSISISVFILSTLNSLGWYLVIVGFLALSFSAAIPVWNALHGDLSTEHTRTKFISQVAMIGSFSSSVLLLIGGAIIDLFSIPNLLKYRIALLISSILFGLTSLIFFFLKEPPKLSKLSKDKYSFFTPFKDKEYRNFAKSTMIWWLVMSFLWPLYPYVVYGVTPTTLQIAILSLSHTSGLLLSQWFAGSIADKLGRKFSLFFGFMLISSVPAILALVTSWHMIIVSNTIAGIANGFIGISLNSEILHLAPRTDMRGTYTGTYNMLMGICTFSGSFISGFIFERITPLLSFEIALSAFLFMLCAARLLASTPTLLLSINEKKY